MVIRKNNDIFNCLGPISSIIELDTVVEDKRFLVAIMIKETEFTVNKRTILESIEGFVSDFIIILPKRKLGTHKRHR